MMDKTEYMRRAVALSKESMEQGGGPFGAVVVRDGRIVGEGANHVTRSCDPTAHAEIAAIRRAAENLRDFDLGGCEIYTSCEPCPMCLGAIYWARIDRIYYANNRQDAKEAGFDDALIYQEIARKPEERTIPMEKLSDPDARRVFDDWIGKEGKTGY